MHSRGSHAIPPCSRLASGDDLAGLAQLIDAGRLEAVVDRVLPFAQVAEAIAYLESGRAKGKVVARMIE